MFNCHRNSGDFNPGVISSRGIIYIGVWRFDCMCIFDHMVDQDSIWEKEGVKGREVQNRASYSFAIFAMHIMRNKLNSNEN